MYGDTEVIRGRAAQLREQGDEVRAAADDLVAGCEEVAWGGHAAESLRARVRDRAARLREVAERHELAADSLTRHAREVDARQAAIAEAERRATALVGEARVRADLPPAGHRDWLGLDLSELG